jgi:Zinc carboxypeptidase
MRRKRNGLQITRVFLVLILAFSPFLGGEAQAQNQVTSPEKFFGFQLGADRQMARWDKMVEYYKVLEKASPRIKVVDMGPSTMGNPFLLVIISSPTNLGRLEQLRQMNARISDPRGAQEAEIKKLVAEGKAVVVQSMSLHATEIGGSQMAPELAYDLVSSGDAETQRILDNVIFLMIPSFNPDGQIMVTDWYQKTLKTESEGVNYPSLYHKYAGHDNNRDAFQTNLIESRYMARILFREWIPQAYIDHHHMGSYGARLYVPPYAEPVRPFADPLVWRELSWYGAHIAYKEEEASKSGIVNSAIYSGWGHFGFHWITPFHNIAGMLTESANARLATPLYIHPDQLRGETRGLPKYEEQTTFPNPWPGGWWKLRDIVERQKISAWAALDLAARNRETVLWNAYLKAKRQTERGAQGKPAAYVIPANQHDPLTAAKLVNQLLIQGIEVHQARKDFSAADVMYKPGSFVVSMAQPKMGVIRWLLGRTHYPDNSYTRDRDGNPIRPYDMATDTMAEFMGIRVDPVDEAVQSDLAKVAAPVELAGKVAKGNFGYSMDGRLNDSFRAVNLLFDKGVAVRRAGTPGDPSLRAGDFIVAAGSDAVVGEIARQTGVDFNALQHDVKRGTYAIKRPRIGMYQRYYGGNMDEGWTRWLLEHFGFPYTSLKDAEIKSGGLEARYDAIILPSDSPGMITGERDPERANRAPVYPPEYRSGIGKEGVEALKAFVQKGGTLVTFGEAGALAIEKFELPLRNVVAGRKPAEFWCPGSTLKVKFDQTNPLAYGMPLHGLAVFLAGSQAYEIIPTDRNDKIDTVVTFADREILRSGWLLGEELIARKAAMVSAQYGEGKVVLIGFRPQHRAQTHGTFKVVFNALVNGPERSDH